MKKYLIGSGDLQLNQLKQYDDWGFVEAENEAKAFEEYVEKKYSKSIIFKENIAINVSDEVHEIGNAKNYGEMNGEKFNELLLEFYDGNEKYFNKHIEIEDKYDILRYELLPRDMILFIAYKTESKEAVEIIEL